MITACIVLLYLSYSIPVICLLIKGRSNITPGPFWLGPIGYFANIVLLLWTLFTLVMYSFPYAKPVTAGNMNCKYYTKVYLVLCRSDFPNRCLRGLCRRRLHHRPGLGLSRTQELQGCWRAEGRSKTSPE